MQVRALMIGDISISPHDADRWYSNIFWKAHNSVIPKLQIKAWYIGVSKYRRGKKKK